MQINDKIEDIAKRRGFFWRSSEIYGGLSGLYDYGHLGTLMKRKWGDVWRRHFLEQNFYEIDPAVIMPEQVFIASGHKQNFVDPMVKCKKCGTRERADHIIQDVLKENFEGMSTEDIDVIIKKRAIKCPKCKGQLKNVGTLNMMFPVQIGEKGAGYMRPETAQGVYVNFRRIFEQMRKKIPLGLAIIGKAYRNEISPRNALLRMREFTQAELQIFFNPDNINKDDRFQDIEDQELEIKLSGKEERIKCKDLAKKLPKSYVYYLAKIQDFYLKILKIPSSKFRFRELGDEERAFYNKYHFDVELKIEDWVEVGGLHYRTDHDLKGHEKISKQDMSVFSDNKKFVPHVLELSFGVDRNIYALLVLSYEEKERSVFHFPRLVSPFDCAIFPLVNKEKMPEKAREIKEIIENIFTVFYDESGSIGRRYRRMDEIGVPICITIDGQSLKDDTVTIRDRDTMKQIRVKTENLSLKLCDFLNGKKLENI